SCSLFGKSGKFFQGESPAIWEEDERSHRSGVGRWVYTHGYSRLYAWYAVVLEIAGLPEPPKIEPSDTMPFLF
ncbi:hypothetical protein IKQ19_20955, partial [Candidatus Saccharibacteria bacterium]|nr:hypothetical protein [Candidatus Saccharibacteria bacterium]